MLYDANQSICACSMQASKSALTFFVNQKLDWQRVIIFEMTSCYRECIIFYFFLISACHTLKFQTEMTKHKNVVAVINI